MNAPKPKISEILSRLNIPPGRRGRTICPIHQGENKQAFSYNDDKGIWYCFRCGSGGDSIDLVKKCLQVDFQGALNWLGIDNGEYSIPNPEKWDKGKRWHKVLEREREMREEFRIRQQLEIFGMRRLRSDPDSATGWNLLSAAYLGRTLPALEDDLDELMNLIPREI